MTRLTDDQLAADAAAAGFAGPALVKITAIELAESGGDPNARGDLSLVNGTWGPSIGLAQIRSLNAQRGTGGVRDELANYDPLTNDVHAFSVSGGGQNFGPWSTFTSGTYTRYLDRAQAAVAHVLGGKVPMPKATDLGFGSRLIGPGPNPAAAASSTAGLSGGGGSLFDSIYRTLIFATLAAGAVALVVMGGWRSVPPGVRAAPAQAAQVAAVAA